MVEFLLNNLLGIAGVLTIPVAWWFGGKQAKAIELRKNTVDALKVMQESYDVYVLHSKERYDELIKDISLIKITNTDLQKQFNEMYIQYAKELEKSQNWERLHNELQKRYEILQKQHDKLKADFETLKTKLT